MPLSKAALFCPDVHTIIAVNFVDSSLATLLAATLSIASVTHVADSCVLLWSGRASKRISGPSVGLVNWKTWLRYSDSPMTGHSRRRDLPTWPGLSDRVHVDLVAGLKRTRGRG